MPRIAAELPAFRRGEARRTWARICAADREALVFALVADRAERQQVRALDALAVGVISRKCQLWMRSNLVDVVNHGSLGISPDFRAPCTLEMVLCQDLFPQLLPRLGLVELIELALIVQLSDVPCQTCIHSYVSLDVMNYI